jgi:outer membrane protein TolC
MNLKKRYAGRLKILFCLTIFLLLCPNLTAQETAQTTAPPMMLSPGEAVRLAVKNNLALETSRASAATKRRASDLSWNQFIPNITLGGSLIRDNKQGTTSFTVPIPGTGIPFSYEGVSGVAGPQLFVSDKINMPQWHIAGTIQASVNINYAMFENMKRLQLDYESGLISYEKAKAQLERDVRKAYHNMLLLQENITLLRGSFENAGRQVQMAQANYDAGLAPELTLLQAQVARENMRPIIDQAENGLKLSMAQFAMFLGLDYNTPFELEPVTENSNFIPIDVAQMIQKASTAKPDIQELRHAILLLQSARKAQFYLLMPSLSLSWNNNSVFIKDPWKDSWFSGDDWNNSGSLTISVGVRLHSLIPFSVDYQGIKNLDDQITATTLGLTQMIRLTEIEIYNTVLALEKARISAEAQAQTVRLAEQSFSLTEQAYQAGLQDYFQVQNAEQSLRQARVQMLEQQFIYLNGLIDLEYSTGVPFGTLNSKEFNSFEFNSKENQ